MTLLLLIAKMIVCSAIFYEYYWLFLRNKKFHPYNRFYLLGAASLSILVPFIRIPISFEPGNTTGLIVYRSIETISVNYWENEFVENPSPNTLKSWFTIENSLYVVYAIGFLVLLYLLLRAIFYIRNISKAYPYESIGGLKLYHTTEPGTPFSFFRSIFWNSHLSFTTKEGQQIFRHELFHVKQRHSADILFLEFICLFFWINPIFHLIKKEIKAIHEFLADQHAVSDNNQYEYAELLVLQSINAKKNYISNYFFQTHIKRRIAMITQFKNKNYSYWTRLMVLPLTILLFCAVALYAKNPTPSNIKKESSQPIPQPLPAPITVLIDAGHGGTDEGAKSDNGLLEKDFTLAIAKQIKQHAAAYNINILMTREDDTYPAIKERATMATTFKADLIIAVHVAGAAKIKTDAGYIPNPANGFDIYVTNKNQQTVGQSKILGQEIAKQINSFYTVGAIKQRKENGIWMLDAVPCPAVLIECGYITNEKDAAFIGKTENQEKIAKSILEGIVSYQSGLIKSKGETTPGTKRV